MRRLIHHVQRRDATVRSSSRHLSKVLARAKSTVILDRIGKLDGKRGWQAIAVVRGKAQKEHALSPPLQGLDGSVAMTPESKVELLVQSMFPSIDRDAAIPWEDLGVVEVGMPRATREEVLAAIKEVAVDKAGGPDGIPPKLLRQGILLCTEFLDLFVEIVNHVLQLGEMPEDWTQATISVIPKPGSHCDLRQPKSYHPILLLNVTAKLMDAIVTRRIHYLSVHAPGFLSLRHHYSSVPGVLTADAIGDLLEAGRNTLRSGMGTAMACIDVGGAFNNIDHDLLIDEMLARQQPALARWLTIWLEQRSFCVRFEGFVSKRYYLGSRGVPQGLPISPILWTLYLDTFFQSPEVHDMEDVLVQGGYVDDLFVLAKGATPEAATMRVQEWMDRLYDWCQVRGLSLGTTPTLV